MTDKNGAMIVAMTANGVSDEKTAANLIAEARASGKFLGTLKKSLVAIYGGEGNKDAKKKANAIVTAVQAAFHASDDNRAQAIAALDKKLETATFEGTTKTGGLRFKSMTKAAVELRGQIAIAQANERERLGKLALAAKSEGKTLTIAEDGSIVSVE